LERSHRKGKEPLMESSDDTTAKANQHVIALSKVEAMAQQLKAKGEELKKQKEKVALEKEEKEKYFSIFKKEIDNHKAIVAQKYVQITQLRQKVVQQTPTPVSLNVYAQNLQLTLDNR